MRGLTLNNVLIPTAALAESTRFFQEGLGLELKRSGDTFAWFRERTTNLMLVASPDEPSTGGPQFEFAVPDLDAAVVHLESLGFEAGSERSAGGVRQLSVREPGGNLVLIVEFAG